jgi:hypothetical protein
MTSTPYLIASKKFFKLSETCNTIIENIFLGYALAVLLLCPFEDKITDAVFGGDCGRTEIANNTVEAKVGRW